jgi:4-deoxy-L-threo-5-hexosulose-uronate ketol-isomerase
MEPRQTVGQNEYAQMDTGALRSAFAIESLFTPGKIETVLWEVDRTVIGSAVPLASPLTLETDKELAAEFFCERRELGALNLGGAGWTTVDGVVHALEPLDCLYIGRGSREVVFESADPSKPARFYLVSHPAHAAHPTTLIRHSDAKKVELGDQATANRRTLHQYIHEGGTKSCQLVMGFTRLAPGNVWNTMPPHTHSRRSEVYLYFDMAETAAVFHFMGPGDETRHLVLKSWQAALSPSWSIHAGCGTAAYAFVWAMGGENQRFDDMDGIAVTDLR